MHCNYLCLANDEVSSREMSRGWQQAPGPEKSSSRGLASVPHADHAHPPGHGSPYRTNGKCLHTRLTIVESISRLANHGLGNEQGTRSVLP
jgi:hypothetical protein